MMDGGMIIADDIFDNDDDGVRYDNNDAVTLYYKVM